MAKTTKQNTNSDTATSTQISEKKTMTLNKLTSAEERVIVNKGTEAPFTGEYYDHKEAGTYTCRQCETPLYRSGDKFESGCGWPSFDDEIPGSVKRTTDADGRRTEITCVNCDAHLGHVFEGERFTDKNTRHCVNSISLKFIPESEANATMMSSGDKTSKKSDNKATKPVATETTYFAGGCFWGTEHLLQKVDGVLSTRVGYIGGETKNPTYKTVSYEKTGHAETVEIVFDPNKTNYETLARMFFEIHDPTQLNRQGGDVGDQYRSAVFYTNEAQKQTTDKLIGLLHDKGFKVVTEVSQAGTFYEAEKYHQDYYNYTGKQPYCHFYTKRF